MRSPWTLWETTSRRQPRTFSGVPWRSFAPSWATIALGLMMSAIGLIGWTVDEFLHRINRVFSPQLIVFGGGISKRFDDYAQWLNVDCDVVPAELRNDAGIVGAAVAAALEVGRGLGPDDLVVVAEVSPHVSALPLDRGGSGYPRPGAARGGRCPTTPPACAPTSCWPAPSPRPRPPPRASAPPLDRRRADGGRPALGVERDLP